MDNIEELDEKQRRMLISKEKDTLEEIIKDNFTLKGEIQDLREKISENKFDKIDGFFEKQIVLEEEITAVKESEKKSIQLQYSYEFWEKQSQEYTKKFSLYSMLSIISSLLLIGIMFGFFYFNPVEIKTKVSNADISIIKNNQIWIYGIAILFSSMYVWFIRITVKITLSNYHLSTDANERVIMIRTYLSLLKEGNGFDKDDKKVMLDNIFRPTNFGIIKDDTKVTIMDILGSKNK